MQSPFRIALTDQILLRQLETLRTSASFLFCTPAQLPALVGKVELFLLDDATTFRFLAGLSEATWPSIVVTVREGESLPEAFTHGRVDDLLVLPPRAHDVERLRQTQGWMRALHEMEKSSRGVGQLVRHLQEDILLAQKIQRRLIRDKFAPLGPLSLKTKYWCGMQSGGDYFDFFEIPGGTHAGLLLADASSYALSTGLLGSLIHFSAPMGPDGKLVEPNRVVHTLLGNLREKMKDKDRLSILYGTLDRKTYELRFVACGPIYLARRGKDGAIDWIYRGEHAPLGPTGSVAESATLRLEPGDRLLACTDGWGEALAAPVPGMVEEALARKIDSQEVLNELTFQLRTTLEKREAAEGEAPEREEGDFPMPPQDCSVMLFDLAANTLRLAT